MYRLDPFNNVTEEFDWGPNMANAVIHPIKTVNNSLLLLCMDEVWISFTL